MQRVLNYGSVLQAYSLQKLIEECTGEKPVFIDIEEERTVPSDRSDLKREDGGKPMAYPGGIWQKALPVRKREFVLLWNRSWGWKRPTTTVIMTGG